MSYRKNANLRSEMMRLLRGAAPASRVGHDCSTRCGLAGKQNSSVSSHCTWSARGLATHHGLPSRATCWSQRMILLGRQGRRRWWWRG